MIDDRIPPEAWAFVLILAGAWIAAIFVLEEMSECPPKATIAEQATIASAS